MWDLLKSKISNFISKIKGEEEEEEKKVEEEKPVEKKEEAKPIVEEKKPEVKVEEKKEAPKAEGKKPEAKKEPEKKKEEPKEKPVPEEKINGVRITYFVHGTTTDNEEGLSTGQAPGELSELGEKQSKELPSQIKGKKFDAVFCSDLKRAIDSAEISFGDKYKIIRDERLRECDYGDLTKAKEEKINYNEHIEKPFPNGESLKDVERRIADFLNFLKKNYEGKHIAIVAHKSPQLALEVLTKDKTWQQAIAEDWRIKKAWQPGWEYSVEKEFKIEQKPLIPFSIPFFGGPKPEVKEEIKPEVKEEIKPKPKPEPKAEVKPAAPIAPAPKGGFREAKLPGVAGGGSAPAKEERAPFVSAAPEEQKEGIEIKVGLADKLKKAVLGKIKLSKDKVEEITDELEFSLIQADVHPDVAAEVCNKIKERMGDREFARGDLENEIKEILKEVFEKEAFGENKAFDLVDKVRAGKKPYKILFVGPNGAGKTTTIAKVARMLMDAGFTVVISASDTFRAAAIEQTEEHGKRLGVRVIRQNYGADAAAVAFDAIKHAEANKIDAVLIDSAGRQDTNFNLLKELQKINRIAAPDARIFIGESIAGNSLYQQVGKFKEMIGLDGVILTKADCDAKGGTAISILRETGVPIIYLGMGQAYTDLKKFDPKYIIDNLV